VRRKGSGANERASLAGDALNLGSLSLLLSDVPSKAYNGLEMSRPASQAQYRAEINAWLAGSAPSSC
jgi:hypothetical protein